MKKSEIAVEKFNSILCYNNCAQSVFSVFAEDLGLDKETAVKIATGFGAGMGRMQSVCGAVSGAILAISLKYGNDMENTYKITRDFIQKFKETTTAVECMDLLDGCNLLTEKGQTFFKVNELKQKKCSEYVRLSCEILEEIINENHSS